MSLVYEALQKAAQESQRTAGRPAPPIVPAPLPQPPVAAAPPRSSAPTIWITGFSVMLFAVAVSALIVMAKKTTPPTPPPTTTPPVTAVTPAPAAVPAVASADSTANDPRFKLTGIMQLGEKYSAVINGHVVAREQYVDGAIVKSVERDRVTLNVDGREIVVRLF